MVRVTGDVSNGPKDSKEFIICGLCVFQIRSYSIISSWFTNSSRKCLFLIKFSAQQIGDFNLKLSSNVLGIENKCLLSQDGTWQLIGQIAEKNICEVEIDVTVTVDIVAHAGSFAVLYNDNDLTDFMLKGEDGSVQMHRAVLAATSPVLRRMLRGTWKETSEGHVDVSGTSKETLQHLKNYLYLHTVPEVGLEQLLLLAAYYMVSDLERKCVDKLMIKLKAENTVDLLQFAVKHNITSLVLSILDCVGCGAVSAREIRDCVMKTEEMPTLKGFTEPA
ncbi:unnamed protein product [Leptosia nina]|uniref:BTB domain-containing protein n=1 Tax=Leptosia nina TaxID=320188 RepID=A0AAV1JMH7_9NEOP